MAVSASLKTPSERATNPVTQSYTALARAVRSLDLQGRTRWFYVLVFAALVVAFGGAVTGFILLDNSWLQLLIAGALGLIFTQFAFLGHEASHRQIMTSGPANDWIGRLLATVFVGISYAWWMNKHTRHHANPNKVGKDPDIETDAAIAFTEEFAARQRGLLAWITRRQGYLFFPLLLLEGVNLHVNSIRGLFRRGRVEGRGTGADPAGTTFRRLPCRAVLAAAPGHGVRVHRRPARCLWAVHGRLVRP